MLKFSSLLIADFEITKKRDTVEINQQLVMLKKRHQEFTDLGGNAGVDVLKDISDAKKSVLTDLAYKLYRDIRNLQDLPFREYVK